MEIYKTYEELVTFDSFKDRFRYLMLNGHVGFETFGEDRKLNQDFYASSYWKDIRRYVIARDFGCDLGILGNEIPGVAYVHHINPITQDDIINRSDILLNPNYLITVSFGTHNAIHYGDKRWVENMEPLIRLPGDTCPWR